MALSKFERTRGKHCGSTDPHSAGNGSIMRLAPVPMFFRSDPKEVSGKSGLSSCTTHQAKTAIDGCRYLGTLIAGALNHVEKEELLTNRYHPISSFWSDHPLCSEIDETAMGSFKRKNPPVIKGTGYVVKSLEAALWAFHNSETFEEGALMAVNLGDDADTTGAVYGQIAGAYYGLQSIPEKWVDNIIMHELIETFAEELLKLSAAFPSR